MYVNILSACSSDKSLLDEAIRNPNHSIKMKSKVSRRDFLMMTGGTGAALMLKPGEKYLHKLISYVNPPLYPKPGEWAFYSTACRECPAGCGMLLWHRDGRITKAEGNPLHLVNKGKLCVRGQSSVQGEYNADRLSKVLKKNNNNYIETNWDEAFTSIRRELDSGKKLLVMSDLQTGSLLGVMEALTHAYNAPAPLLYEPLNYESLRLANKEMYGVDLIPRYTIEGADIIVNFGTGFLETWLSPVEYARDFSNIHTLKDNVIGKHIYVGPSETLTAMNADEFIKVTPGIEADIIFDVIRILVEKGIVNYNTHTLPTSSLENQYKQAIEKIAEQLSLAKKPVILAGSPEDSTIHGINTVKAANLLNDLLGNSIRADYSQYHALSKTAYKEDIRKFLESITSNHVLIIHGANLVYSIGEAANYIKRAGMIVYIGNTHNETAELAHWILPSNYPLEDWGDYEPWKGTITLMQPTMRPLYGTKSVGDIFLILTSGLQDKHFKDIVWENWRKWSELTEEQSAAENGVEQNYRHLLRKGYIQYNPDHQNKSLQHVSFIKLPSIQLNNDEVYLYAFSSLFFYDGRLSNRPWLQEISHPVSNIVWQSWIDMSTATANKIGIEEGDVIKVIAGPATLEVSVRLTDKIADNTIALELGQGHWGFGKTADGIGINAFSLLTLKNSKALPTVTIEKTGRNEALLYLNDTKDQHGRELIKEVDLNNLHNGQFLKEEIAWPTPQGYNVEKDLYKPHQHKGHRWGMVIDLQACIGCKACEAACYAENNIPVVGKEGCKEGREMSWLKVPPYKIKNNKTAFIPTPCQHCDAAPCEPVCPVFASVHTEEGLNAQIYNRCIGTRYCSNNCPYKVRRFNWSNIKHEYPMLMQLNPEVTVRERGVMEKCTFCVQRIRNAEDKAKIENRDVEDGEIVTACQQTCPTGAIIFGDINNLNSQVRGEMNNDRRYQLLKELNTKPAVVYLKKININI